MNLFETVMSKLQELTEKRENVKTETSTEMQAELEFLLTKEFQLKTLADEIEKERKNNKERFINLLKETGEVNGKIVDANGVQHSYAYFDKTTVKFDEKRFIKEQEKEYAQFIKKTVKKSDLKKKMLMVYEKYILNQTTKKELRITSKILPTLDGNLK